MQRIVAFIAIVIASVVSTGIAAVSIPFMLISEGMAHAFFRIWGKSWFWILGVKVELHGESILRESGPMVLAPNHQSIFDIFVAAALPINFKWILKRELMFVPILGWAIRAMGNYWVRRDGSGADLRVMQKVEAGLKSGRTVLIFPEGTRTRTGELLGFKKGAFRVAQNAGVPICPMAFIGTFSYCPPDSLPKAWGGRVTVRVGIPFTVEQAGSLAEAQQRLREEVGSLLALGHATAGK